MEKSRTIRVTGRANLRVTPDQTCINMSVEGVEKKYEAAVEKSSQRSREIKASLQAAGIDPEEIRTTGFSIDPEYESYEKEGGWKQRFKGYRFRHGLRLCFDSDKEKLGLVFGALAACPAAPEFRVSYRVKDQEKAKSELIAKAVSDAKEKAKVLAKASGVKLKEIQRIDYSFSEIEMEAPMMNLRSLDCVAAGKVMGARAIDIDMDPEDIEITDNVTLVWEIS
ncbi:MAG: SIMPL domain-containing protein [Clostridiales bacterium]|nr:SIMPL domain-containing protein [Clostridiales bacterium]